MEDSVSLVGANEGVSERGRTGGNVALIILDGANEGADKLDGDVGVCPLTDLILNEDNNNNMDGNQKTDLTHFRMGLRSE
jgi:hypothetical protein